MLSSFSPITRAHLFSHGCIVIGQAHRSADSKSATTKKSRQNCFLEFCYKAALKEPTAKHIPPAQSNFLLGCFAISLIQGDNILGLNLKSTTIKGYTSAAADLYEDRSLANPFKIRTIKTNYPSIIIKALAKYEKIPDRREVITDSMFEYIDELAMLSDDDGLHSAFKDWAAWSRYSGPRRSEWCQTSQTKYERAESGKNDEALAISFDDILFYDKHDRLVNLAAPFVQVSYSTVEWRFQKNNDNGEIVKYYANPLSTKWCPAYALWRIKHRAVKLKIPMCEPIAKYKTSEGKVLFITDKHVKTILQQAAKEKMGITDPAILSKWTSHSQRVTAANELHRLGFNALFIKHRLRWKSDAFIKYLRHTIHVARKHTAAMSLNESNLKLHTSNLDKVNERIKNMEVFRAPAEDDILWENNFYATAA